VTPEVSFIVPTFNEEEYLNETLEAIRKQSTNKDLEIIVVDGGSKDQTTIIAKNHNAKIIENIKGRGRGRHVGAKQANGKYLAFIDADTIIREDYTEKMVEFVEENNLVATSSLFQMTGYRAKVMQLFGNFYFPRKKKPLLPGFNTFVRSETYRKQGFENLMGEDLQFSNKIANNGKTMILKEKLVVNSGRRVAKIGLTGILLYYLLKDFARRLHNVTGYKLWEPSEKPF